MVVRTVPGDSVVSLGGLWAIDFVLGVNGMCLGSLSSVLGLHWVLGLKTDTLGLCRLWCVPLMD